MTRWVSTARCQALPASGARYCSCADCWRNLSRFHLALAARDALMDTMDGDASSGSSEGLCARSFCMSRCNAFTIRVTCAAISRTSVAIFSARLLPGSSQSAGRLRVLRAGSPHARPCRAAPPLPVTTSDAPRSPLRHAPIQRPCPPGFACLHQAFVVLSWLQRDPLWHSRSRYEADGLPFRGCVPTRSRCYGHMWASIRGEGWTGASVA